MWLPAPIYDALPTVYVVIGALLLGGVFYEGFQGPMSVVYASLGVIAVVSGIVLRQRRNRAKQSRTDDS